MMDVAPGDTVDPSVEERYRAVLGRYAPKVAPPERIERHAFYERARKAFAVVATGDTAKYGNIILKKGVTPLS